MTQVLDYSLARPDPAAIVAAGYVGVLRYVAPAIDAPKIITPAEYAALLTHNLEVALNWEWYRTRAREGAAAGTADAQDTFKQANTLGYSEDGALYFSVDYDAPESDQPAINDYFIACAQVVGLRRLGGYGGYWVLKRLFDAGLITYGWQTLAWSGGLRENRAHIYQNGAQVLGGCDVNDVLKANWAGGFMIPTGWTDDGTALHNDQNSFVVVGANRQHILDAPFWSEGNIPLENEETLGEGKTQQYFRYARLDYDPAAGTVEAWVGAGLQDALTKLAAFEAQPAPAPGPDPQVAELSQQLQAEKAKIAALKGLVGTLDNALAPYVQLKNAMDQFTSGL